MAPNGKAAQGTLSLSLRGYRDVSLRVVKADKLRNADGFFGKSDSFARVGNR